MPRLSRSPRFSFLPLAEFAHLIAAATAVHVAPASAVILAAVDEEPGTGRIGALAEVRTVLAACEEIRRRARDRPEPPRELIGLRPFPTETTFGLRTLSVAKRVRRLAA